MTPPLEFFQKSIQPVFNTLADVLNETYIFFWRIYFCNSRKCGELYENELPKASVWSIFHRPVCFPYDSGVIRYLDMKCQTHYNCVQNHRQACFMSDLYQTKPQLVTHPPQDLIPQENVEACVGISSSSADHQAKPLWDEKNDQGWKISISKRRRGCSALHAWGRRPEGGDRLNIDCNI